MSISVLLITLNEADSIAGCIDAVSWSDDIVVLDSYSHDNTTELAQRRGARVYQRVFDNFAGQRNYALDHISFKYEWVLHLDADEIVTESLHREMVKVTKEMQYDAWRIPSKMMFFGHWLRYSGMYPSYQVRLGHRDRCRFKQVGHGQQEDLPPARVGTLNEPYLHYSFSKGLYDWFEKHNRYSSAEALAEAEMFALRKGVDWRALFASDRIRSRRALKGLASRLPFRPALRFSYMYFIRRGFLDGKAGFTYCVLLAIYEYLIVLKRIELKSTQRNT